MTGAYMRESIKMVKRESTDRFPCPSCGGNVVFDPDEQMLECPYCGSKTAVSGEKDGIREYDFDSAKEGASPDWSNESRVFRCESCGAESVLDAASTAEFCAFCGSSHIVRSDTSSGIIPESLVPFKMSADKARNSFSAWIRRRLFSPGALRTKHQLQKMSGVYLPYWTYDSDTYSTYTAEAGTYYYVTETDWITENGQRKQVTRQVRKIRWDPVSGTYSQGFDDVLVNASSKMNHELLERIKPFCLEALVGYKAEFLSGFLAKRYDIGLKSGWELARSEVDREIESGIIEKINADEVRNLNVNTMYRNIKYKHILLPVWISSYIYKGKVYQFMVNGQTGAVSGKAPLSAFKIVVDVLLSAGAIAAAALLGKTAGLVASIIAVAAVNIILITRSNQ